MESARYNPADVRSVAFYGRLCVVGGESGHFLPVTCAGCSSPGACRRRRRGLVDARGIRDVRSEVAARQAPTPGARARALVGYSWLQSRGSVT